MFCGRGVPGEEEDERGFEGWLGVVGWWGVEVGVVAYFLKVGERLTRGLWWVCWSHGWGEMMCIGGVSE